MAISFFPSYIACLGEVCDKKQIIVFLEDDLVQAILHVSEQFRVAPFTSKLICQMSLLAWQPVSRNAAIPSVLLSFSAVHGNSCVWQCASR